MDNSTGLCLNVDDYGVSVGDQVWVTMCHPEKPVKANSAWVLKTKERENKNKSGSWTN